MIMAQPVDLSSQIIKRLTVSNSTNCVNLDAKLLIQFKRRALPKLKESVYGGDGWN